MERYFAELIPCKRHTFSEHLDYVSRMASFIFSFKANKLSESADKFRESAFVLSAIYSWLHIGRHHKDEDTEHLLRERLLQQTEEDVDKFADEKRNGYCPSCRQCNAIYVAMER